MSQFMPEEICIIARLRFEKSLANFAVSMNMVHSSHHLDRIQNRQDGHVLFLVIKSSTQEISTKFVSGSIYWVPTVCQYIADSYINFLFHIPPNLNELCAKGSKSRLDDLWFEGDYKVYFEDAPVLICCLGFQHINLDFSIFRCYLAV